jgi:sulfur relay protein TusB/DsrH
MAIVYLIGKSLFNDRSLETYFGACKLQARERQEVAMIFMQDGVLIAPHGNIFERPLIDLKRDGVQIYFRKEDLSARGISSATVSPVGMQVDTKKIMAMLAGAKTIVSVL